MAITIQSGTVKNFTASRSTDWHQVTFPNPFPTTPVVFSQIQTFVGADTPGLRMQNVTSKGFEVRMDELQASNATSSKQGDLGRFLSDGIHPNAEVLGWIAVG